MAVQPEDIRLLANSRFRRLMEARAVAQTGQNAMLYTLLILVVNETASSIHSTLLITAWMLPCIVLGVPAGGLADVLPKRALLVTGYAVRAALAAAMILYVDDVWTLYLLALMVGQGVGAVALAPFILKFISAETCLAIAALLLAAAAFIATSVTGLRAGAGGPAAPPRGAGAGARGPARAAGGRGGRVAGGGVVRPVDEPAGLPGAGLPDGCRDAGEGAGGPRASLHPRRAADRYGEHGVRGGPGGDRGAAGAGGDATAGAVGRRGEDSGGRVRAVRTRRRWAGSHRLRAGLHRGPYGAGT